MSAKRRNQKQDADEHAYPEGELPEIKDPRQRHALETIRTRFQGVKKDPTETIRGNERVHMDVPTNISSMITLRRQTIADKHTPHNGPVDYELNRLLGKGGMGWVYEARQTSLDRTIALKMLNMDKADTEAERNEFLAEAVVTGELAHPNIVPIYDVAFNEQGQLFYSMKRVEGTVWRKVLKTYSLFDNLDVLMKVADAISFSHSRGIIHRDLKPDNVMLGDHGEVLVTDWGLAADVSGASKAGRMTDDPQLCGTPLYMAPEMALGDQAAVGIHSDIYLLGAVLFEIVTGKQPRSKKVRFWDCILDAANNMIEPTDRKSELLNIAYKAMSTAPADRHESVKAFQQEVQEYRAHAESANLVALAEEGIELAEQEQRYERYAEAVADFKQALKLWPENHTAHEGLSEALRKYAAYALSHNEPELAASLLDPDDPEHAILYKRVATARLKRKHKRWRLLILRVTIAFMLLSLALLATYFVRDYYFGFEQWELIYKKDFLQDQHIDDLFFCTENLEVESIPPDLALEQRLRLPANYLFWLRNVHERHNVRLEIEASWPQAVDGLEMMINARWIHPQRFAFSPPGYTCQFGGWGGAYTFISRNAQSQGLDLTDAVSIAFNTGQVYRLVIQRLNDEVSLWVNDKQVQQRMWVLPLEGEHMDRIAVRSWGDVDIHTLKVYRRGLPRKASPLTVGDALYAAGNHQAALQQYLYMAEDFPGHEIEARALAKAFAIACQENSSDHKRLAHIKANMERKYRNSPYWIKMLEAECFTNWRNENYDQAMALLKEVRALAPDHRLPLELLSVRRNNWPETQTRELLRFVADIPDLVHLDIKNIGLTDLSPLAGMPLEYLNCSGNRIGDLAPLSNMPLTYLDCADNRIDDLAPLANTPLSYLKCSDNQLPDLAGLEGTSLEHLDCDHNAIQELTPLIGSNLKRLSCARNKLRNVKPLRALNIQDLDLSHNEIVSLEPLRGMPLKKLNAANNRIANLAPLAGNKALLDLDVSFNDLDDLTPLKNLLITKLNCAHNQVTNLMPLRGCMALKELDCSANMIDDLSHIGRLPLHMLNCAHNLIDDLRPLAGLPIQELDCSFNEIRNLASLRDLPLHTLLCSGNDIAELQPLPALAYLECEYNPLTSLAPFETEPPAKGFFFTETMLDPAYLNRILNRWESRQALRDTARMTRIRLALATQDLTTLRHYAATHEGRRYLFVVQPGTWSNAVARATTVGGHLVTIADADEDAFVLDLLPVRNWNSWLGLYDEANGATAWIDNTPLTYRHFLDYDLRQPDRPWFHSRWWNVGLWSQAPASNSLCHAFVIEWEEDYTRE